MRGTVALLPLLALLTFSAADPSFYCFVTPPERTSFDPNLLSNISCTHFVYGQIPIDNPRGRPEFSNWDVAYESRDGNMRRFLRLRSIHRDAKFLLGVQRTTPFRDSGNAIKVAKGVKMAYTDKRFDGVFVNFKGYHLQRHSSAVFIDELAKSSPMKPTIGVTAYRIWQKEAVERLRQISESVDKIYVDMSVLPTNEDPFVVTKVDPLFSNGTIHYEDTIQGTMDKLNEEGIMADKIILGLTAGGWRFKVSNLIGTDHGDFAKEKGERIGYQDACKARGSVIFDKSTLNEITLHRQLWTVSNLPTMEAMGRKVQWALSQNFGGVGISSIYQDDPKSECGTDPLPSHRMIMTILHETLPSSRAKCSRLCYLDSSEILEDFPFDSFKSEFCSHLILDFFQLDLQKIVMIPEKSEKLLARVEEWRKKVGDVAPRLILSMGSREKSNVWSLLLADEMKRKNLVQDVLKTIDEHQADGLEISWTLEPLNNEFDKKNLNSLIEDIDSSEKKHPVELLVGVTAQSSYANLYDVTFFNKTIDMVILHSHQLHSPSASVTGHPSFLHPTTSSGGSNMTVSNFLTYWTSQGMTRNRLAVSISARPMTMSTVADRKTMASSSAFGKAIFQGFGMKSENRQLTSQQEICEAIKMKSVDQGWDEQGQVPYLIRDGQVIAYDNEKSVRIKTIWASMEGVGLAVHGIQADDPMALCDNKTAFPIMTQMTRMQVCPKCLKPHNFRKCIGHQFIVSCSFDLKKSKPLFRHEIVPYERCTEVVVEQASINSAGNISFHDDYETQVVQNLTTLRSKMGKCGLVMSLSCGKSEKALKNLLLDDMHKTIDKIMATMTKFNFSGVQLDCENVVKRSNYIQFNNFIKFLNHRIHEEKASNGCNRTLSMRFSSATTSPNSLYRISQLNQLSHISLTHTSEPFFNINTTTSESGEELIHRWIKNGMNSTKIVLEISPAAQSFSPVNGTQLGHLTQGQICETIGNRVVFIDNYENLTASFSGDVIVEKPTIAAIKYKVGYALREKLGGVSMRNVNSDDYTGICGRGSFPMLKSIYDDNRSCH